jgi:phosphatidylglycerol:prolipoprotein diacylglycerol transferase
MRQTLFYLPHQVGPLPLFGWVSWSMLGLALYILLLVALGRKTTGLFRSLQENAFNWGLVAVVFGVLLPWVETKLFAGTPQEVILGLPVRGYGMMLMLGVISAVAIAKKRIERLGVSADAFLSLALWVILGGLGGARIFYVVQKWNELDGTTWFEKLKVALQFTEGGLVVYGSVLGGIAGLVIWTLRNRVHPIPLLDAVVPAFFIGLAFGRIGCLLNGCCYGGLCESNLPSIAFPRGSPAYMDQLEHGQLLGIRTREHGEPRNEIESVEEDGWAASRGVQAGQKLQHVQVFVSPPLPESPTAPPEVQANLMVDGNRFTVSSDSLPDRSLSVHPSQIYASIGGVLLCLWTLSIQPWWQRPGTVFGAGLVAYGIVRILEEIIRVDEQGVLGTPLSISQWVSVLGITAGLIILFFSSRDGFRSQAADSATALNPCIN